VSLCEIFVSLCSPFLSLCGIFVSLCSVFVSLCTIFLNYYYFLAFYAFIDRAVERDRKRGGRERERTTRRKGTPGAGFELGLPAARAIASTHGAGALPTELNTTPLCTIFVSLFAVYFCLFLVYFCLCSVFVSLCSSFVSLCVSL